MVKDDQLFERESLHAACGHDVQQSLVKWFDELNGVLAERCDPA
jgi:hypothetical protein